MGLYAVADQKKRVNLFAANRNRPKEAAKVIDPHLLYDQTEVARFLGKLPAWLERSRWNGQGPEYVKVGRTPRYKGSTNIELIEALTRQSTAQN